MSDTPDLDLEAAAEEVRAHLVALRGGAPFLSPADARLLLKWLERDGRTVPEICAALEQAAVQRQKRRSRIPLRLSHASRYLSKAPPTRLTQMPAHDPGDHPLQDWIDTLLELDALWAAELAASVFSLSRRDTEQFLRGILAAQRVALEAYWTTLGHDEQVRRWDAAVAAVRARTPDLDEATTDKLAEERVRDQLRSETPLLTAASLLEHLTP